MTPLADQSIFVRARDQRRDSRGGDRRGADRADDPALPRQLAQHADHRGLDSALDSGLDHRAERAGRDDQHHDPRRPGAGGRHPGRRRHGDDREHRAHLEEGQRSTSAILDGAAQIAVPALVSTLCICIVFLPMFLLGGVAQYLFVPLAEAVVFAMLASYVLSRTLVPTLAMYLLKSHEHYAEPPRLLRALPAAASSAASSACATRYQRLLTRLVAARRVFIPVFLLLCLSAFLLVPWLGQDFFPEHRQRAVHPACPRQDRPAHRGDRAALRPGRGRDPQGDPGRRSSTTSSTTSACPTAR